MTAITKAQIERAITAMESTGHTVTAIRLSPDGCIDLLTYGLAPTLASNDDAEDWLSLAGQTEVPRAQGS
jgi:hypothetical protein